MHTEHKNKGHGHKKATVFVPVGCPDKPVFETITFWNTDRGTFRDPVIETCTFRSPSLNIWGVRSKLSEDYI